MHLTCSNLFHCIIIMKSSYTTYNIDNLTISLMSIKPRTSTRT